MSDKPAEFVRVRILRAQQGPAFHADVGEERTVMKAHGEQLLEAGDAELVKAASGSGASAPAERQEKTSRKR